MRYRSLVLVAGMAASIVSINVPAQGSNLLGNYVKQDGFIQDTAPVPYASAEEALRKLRLSANQPDHSLENQGIVTYSDAQTLSSYMTFVQGSPFYPSVARRRIVLAGDHLETHTTILCGVTAALCAQIHTIFNAMDKVCGNAIKGCPGYSDDPLRPTAASLIAPAKHRTLQ
jgi:hypothetical protein